MKAPKVFSSTSEPRGSVFHRGWFLHGSRLLPHPPQSVAGGGLSSLVSLGFKMIGLKTDADTRFESVEKTLSEERTKIAGQRAGEKEDSNKQSTQTLTIRSRLSIIINNYQLAFACHEL